MNTPYSKEQYCTQIYSKAITTVKRITVNNQYCEYILQ